MSHTKRDYVMQGVFELQAPQGVSNGSIKKSYRKKALKCHPDKNPDNENAAEEFDTLKKVLEILLDVGARAAYDRVLKSRKEAAIRNRERTKEEQTLRAKLEERERQAADGRPHISEEERFRRELKRLEEEGERLIIEELERLNREVENEMKQASNSTSDNSKSSTQETSVFRVKVKWVATSDWPGYKEEEIHQLFYKWGDINAMVMKQKGNKGTAMIDYANYQGADMAVQFEKGLIGKPVEVAHVTPETMKKPDKKDDSKNKTESASGNSNPFESVADMNRRRQAERQKLIEEILNRDSST
ncbi:unnamed protein product, partial [Meganyctiphanes norvegica]